MKVIYLTAAIFLLFSCTKKDSVPTNTETSTSTVTGILIPPGWEMLPTKPWNHNPDLAAFFGSRIMPKSKAKAGDLCPNIEKVDTTKFYVALSRAIIFTESGFDPHNTYLEKSMGIDPKTGKQVVSEGYWQLSYQDAGNWSSRPHCKMIDYAKKNIQDEQINLQCGLEIFERLATRDNKNLRDALGAYWSAIWPGNAKTFNHLKAEMPECFQEATMSI